MVKIDEKLYQEIKDYCKLNKLRTGDFVNDLLKKAFTVEKYGDRPPFFNDSPKQPKTIVVDDTTTTTPKENETTSTTIVENKPKVTIRKIK